MLCLNGNLPERSDLISILTKLITLEADPNPITTSLAKNGDMIIDKLLEGFTDHSDCNSNTEILLALLTQPLFFPYFY